MPMWRGLSMRSSGSTSECVTSFQRSGTCCFTTIALALSTQVSDVKLALQQWVHSELSVHCAAVERLSHTAALLGAVDPNAAMLR